MHGPLIKHHSYMIKFRHAVNFAIMFAGVLSACTGHHEIDLSGRWAYRLDPMGRGMDEKWHLDHFDSTLFLPGTLAGQNMGDPVTKKTPWIGAIIDSALWFNEKYDLLSPNGEYLVPFWLSPKKFYTGPAWYQKTINIPSSWGGSPVTLELERCHWESTVWLDSVCLGSQHSLSTPHRYKLPPHLKPGKHTLTIRIDNSYIIPVGINAHSVSDNTQGNWNGVVGQIRLIRHEALSIDNLVVYPDVANGSARVHVHVKNHAGKVIRGNLNLSVLSDNTHTRHSPDPVSMEIYVNQPEKEFVIDIPMGNDFLTWDEWNPAVYKLQAEFINKQFMTSQTTTFGMRDFSTRETQFLINDRPVFLRGTLECSIFPNEGHPPADYATWERIFKTVRRFGLNHMRFHSWCPPRAAFEAADNIGVYLMIECGAWATQGLKLGAGEPIDLFAYQESKRIVREYGNHPSFCMMAYGNEGDGEEAVTFLENFVRHWKNKDARRLYTSSAGWPVTAENQFFSTLQARIQEWTPQGSTYYIEDNPPSTAFDYSHFMPHYDGPFVSHEIGQWCAYPDICETDQYTGAYHPDYLKIYKAELEMNGLLHQANDFLHASGKWQAICYKAEIEAALRTKAMGGFQLLDLRDFPGQGVAIVGVLNALWEEKGYISAKEFRQFCDSTVLLAAIDRLVLTCGDQFRADILLSHHGAMPLPPGIVHWQVRDTNQHVLDQGSLPFEQLENGNGQYIGEIRFNNDAFRAPAKYSFRLFLPDHGIENRWDFYIFPSPTEPGEPNNTVHYTHSLDSEAVQVLEKGGTVWLNVYHAITEDYTIRSGFTPVYWNTKTFPGQPIHTLGLLCDPKHPVFSLFPTDSHTNWQWWDILTNSKAMNLTSFKDIEPVLQMIDTYHSNRKAGLIMEAIADTGKVLVSSINFDHDMDQRPASRQLYKSIKNYLGSNRFNPTEEISMEALSNMLLDAAR